MDEEVFENVVEDVVESVVENVESNEPESTEPAPPVPERPWKKNAPPETIPYNRFSEVISEKHKLEETLKAKEKELEEYYKTKKIVDGMDLSDIDPESQTIEEVIQKVALKVKSQVHAEHQKAEEIKLLTSLQKKLNVHLQKMQKSKMQ